jgi:hypothetical protein
LNPNPIAYFITFSIKGSDGKFLIDSRGETPNLHGPSHEDHISTPDQGIWTPDKLPLAQGWKGSGCAANRNEGGNFFNLLTRLEGPNWQSSYKKRSGNMV